MADTGGIGPRPDRVGTFDELLGELERLRIRAARGRGKTRLSLQDIAEGSGIPKSSVANYLSGATVIPADQLAAMVRAMGASAAETAAWASAWGRAMDERTSRNRASGSRATAAGAHAPTPTNVEEPRPPGAGRDAGSGPSRRSAARWWAARGRAARGRWGALVIAVAVGAVVTVGGVLLARDLPGEPGDAGSPSAGAAAAARRPQCLPVTGDWDQPGDASVRTVAGGSVTAGVACRVEHGMAWTLTDRHGTGSRPRAGGFGNYDWCLPVTGDWDADGATTIGVACGGGSEHAIRWSLINGLAGSPSYPRFRFGDSTACWPVTGDWDGNGTTTAGLACADGNHIRWYIVNAHRGGDPASEPFTFGDTHSCWPLTGDWDADGRTSVGVACRTPHGMRWRLTNGFGTSPSIQFTFGDYDTCRPVTGDWDGNGTTTAGAVCQDADHLRWHLTNSHTSTDPSYPPFRFGTHATYPTTGWLGPTWPPTNHDPEPLLSHQPR